VAGQTCLLDISWLEGLGHFGSLAAPGKLKDHLLLSGELLTYISPYPITPSISITKKTYNKLLQTATYF
jgi:hypothetical protein